MSEETSSSPTIPDPTNTASEGYDKVAAQVQEDLSNGDAEDAKKPLEDPKEVEEGPVTFTTDGQKYKPQKHGRTNSWNFMWDSGQEKGKHGGIALPDAASLASKPTQPVEPASDIWQGLSRKPSVAFTTKTPVPQEGARSTDFNYREQLLERREREFDRREREIDRRERELERRERELERRQREFDQDKARWLTDVNRSSQWEEAINSLKRQLEKDFLAERQKAAQREAELEAKIVARVNDALEKERQFYGLMRMSDKEVNEMVESSVGYLMRDDEEIADRVRFQSLIYLSQEKLASQAGLQPPQGSDSLSLAWRLAVGPSVVTEERYKKAIELLDNKELDLATKKLIENKKALEYVVEYTSHLRKEGLEANEHAFAFGRIPRENYMESVKRQSRDNEADYEAWKALVDFISPEV